MILVGFSRISTMIDNKILSSRDMKMLVEIIFPSAAGFNLPLEIVGVFDMNVACTMERKKNVMLTSISTTVLIDYLLCGSFDYCRHIVSSETDNNGREARLRTFIKTINLRGRECNR